MSISLPRHPKRPPASRRLARDRRELLTIGGMGVSMPVVWSDRHRLHEPDGEIYVGVRTPGTEIPERAERIREALEAAGAHIVPAAEARRCEDTRTSRSRTRPLPALRVEQLGSERAGLGPGAAARRALPLSPPRTRRLPLRRGTGKRRRASWRLLLRHDDLDRPRHLGGGEGCARRRAHGGRYRPGPGRRLCPLPPARTPRHPRRVRRLVLPQQLRRCRGANA